MVLSDVHRYVVHWGYDIVRVSIEPISETSMVFIVRVNDAVVASNILPQKKIKPEAINTHFVDYVIFVV